ncbi:MAG: amidohydrolase [Burkholderiales bacterium]|nr:amidohydrolase [Burkholderiales bacterium]
MAGVIDIWHQPFTPELMKRCYVDDEEQRRVIEWWGLGARVKGRSPEEFVADMDRHGIARVLIPSLQIRSFVHQRMQWAFEPDEIHAIIHGHPDRLHGLYGINPYSRMAGVRALERAVRELGFVGAHIHPYGFELPVDHRRYYPFYTKCVELDVPVVMQIGHSAEAMPSETGRPLLLDTIALDFPELRIVAAHTGWPWVEELIAVAWKHPNVYIATTAHAPRYWNRELVSFLNTRRGIGKVMYGSDFPVLEWADSLEQIRKLELKPEAQAQLLEGSARAVFKF